MPFVAFIHIAIAAFFAVHAVRTDRPMQWLFILFAFPMIGSVVYLFAVYLPAMRYTRQGIKAARTVQAIIDPNRELREASTEFDRTPTAYNRARLAAALLAKGRADEAITHFEQAASGPYAKDAAFLKGLAGAQLDAGRFGAAVATLQRLFDAHPDQRSGELALMHAQALAGAKDPGARAAFEAVMAADDSTEAKCKYGLFLIEQGDLSKARQALEAVLKDAQRGHVHSRELNRDWIAEAKTALARIEPGNA
jgi:hypothetical protein